MASENKSYGDKEIDDLVSDGLKSYALRKYEDAAEKFGKSCEIYSTKNGEENANLLFTYGKALFRVAVSQSQVLGDAGGAVTGDGEEGDEEPEGKQEQPDQDEQQQEDEADQSDFEVAWEILDLSRNLFSKQLEEETDEDKKAEIKKNLAETYDLLGEVSLESENFPQASQDLQESLNLRKELYPIESTLVSESYYKLSLAYEFNFEDNEGKQKSIENMEKAIESVKKRVQVSGQDDPELVNDLELRLQELKNPKDQEDQEDDEKKQALDGILGQGGGDDVKEQLVNALTQANDISSLVRKKRKSEQQPESEAKSSKKE